MNAASVLRDVPKVENSPASPCWQQEQIARQRAYMDSVIGGKTVKYHAECKQKPVPASNPDQKTS